MDNGGGTFPGTIANTDAGNIGNVVKSGVGVEVFTGTNTDTGTTTINAGRLELGPAAQPPVLANAGGADVRGGTLQLDYTAGGIVGTVRGLLAASFNAAATPGVVDSGQIRSSTATAARGLGYRDDGVGAVTITPALFGDADLDGGVSIDDFNSLAGHFGQTSKVWTTGDGIRPTPLRDRPALSAEPAEHALAGVIRFTRR